MKRGATGGSMSYDRGDQVRIHDSEVTYGGLVGTVTAQIGDEVYLEVAVDGDMRSGVEMPVSRVRLVEDAEGA